MEELRGIVRVESGEAGRVFAPAATTSGTPNRGAVATLGDDADPPGFRAEDQSSRRGGGLASYDVFISFRGGDRQIAQRLSGLLARFGVRAFVDETGVAPGTDWASSLRECLAASRAVIALVGPAWALLDRPHEDWVLRELSRALAGGTPILPVCAGKSEDTKSKLAVLPDAFRLQAVEIPLEPTSADARRIVVALGHVNVLVSTPRNRAIASRLRTKKVVVSVVPKLGCGRNVAIAAPRGSGRSRLLVDLAAWTNAGVNADDDLPTLVVCGGVHRPPVTSASFAVVTNWFQDLAHLVRSGSAGGISGDGLASIILRHGPDLLSRRVIAPDALVRLADDEKDEAIIAAAQRVVDPRSTDPPHRLVRQAVSVIGEVAREIHRLTGVMVVLAVDDLDLIDDGSKAVVAGIMQLNDVGLLVTSTTCPEGDYDVISVAAATDDERVLELRAVFADQNVEIDDALARQLVALVDDSYYWAPLLFRLMADGVVRETWSADRRRWMWVLADEAVTVTDPESGFERRDPRAGALTGRLPDFGELLDGVMDDNIPQALQAILRVGSLMTEPFPFEVAMRVAQPACTPAMIDHAWDAMAVAASEGAVVRVVLTRSTDRLLRFSHPDHKTRLDLNFVGKDRRHTHDRIADEFDARLRTQLSPEAEIGTWRAVAHHRAQADGLRLAALAFRRAAELAEAQLDGSAARKCYREAARLLSRCLADGDETGAEINELLLLVNTSYRMARLARLTDDLGGDGDPASDDRQDDRRRRDALRYLDQLEGRLSQPGALPSRFDVDNHEVPMPDPLRHVTRVVHALRGYVLFEQAMGHRDKDEQAKAIDGMLDALHHADRAADEGQGRWLVGAATARYADLLTDAAIDAHDDGLERRCDILSNDALFNIERVLGLTGSTPEDTTAIEQAKRWARATQLRIYQHVHDDPDAVEALVRLHSTPHTRSPLADVLSARLTSAMIDLSELTGADRSHCDRLHDEFNRIVAESDELGLSRLVPRAAYGRALVECIVGADVTPVADVDLSELRPKWRHRIELFNKLFASTAEVCSLDDDTERRALYRLIHDAPALAPVIEARLTGDLDGAVSAAIKRANDYVSRTQLKTGAISFDALIWRLAPARLPDHVLRHSLEVRDRADQLLAVHADAIGGLDRRDIARDLAVAAAVHDWYRDAEPARLRTLAREWNIPIDGSAWANPTLLHGPLAVFVMEHQYGARKLLGNERFDRLSEIVEAHTIGAEAASPAAQIFFLADSMANAANRPHPGHPEPLWCEMAMQNGRLRDAYERAVCAKVARAQVAGRVLTQACRWALDLHPVP